MVQARNISTDSFSSMISSKLTRNPENMKKVLYMVAIATLAIVSCTKDNTKEVNRGHAIDFRVATTRATETTTENLTKIWVTAIGESLNSHFTKVEFTKDGNYFVTPNAYYWPADGSSLTFYAYAPAEATIGGESLTLDGTEQKLTGFAPVSEIKSQLDVTVAVANGSKADSENGVELIFDHILTQVEIQAYSNNTGYKHKVKGVRIGKVGSKGDYDFKLRDWDLSGDKANYQVTYDTPIELTAEYKNIMGDYGKEVTDPSRNGNAMLIPQAHTPWDITNDPANTALGAYIAVLVNIETAEGAVVFPETKDAYDWVAFPLDGEWIRGFKYVYKLDFTNGSGYKDPEGTDNDGESVVGGKIQFTHIIDSWSTSTPTDTDVEME